MDRDEFTVQVERKVKHPAVFTDAILIAVEADLIANGRIQFSPSTVVFDPFAGTGKVHVLPCVTTGMEIEPEWAHQHRHTIVGDSIDYMEATENRYDVVVTSPCYGNRMADHHRAADKCSECRGEQAVPIPGTRRRRTCPKCKGSGLSPRRSYAHDLGRLPTNGSSAILHYGPAYRDFHRRAWAGVYRVLRPGGLAYINTKDHIRDGKVVRVSDWHRRALLDAGFEHLRTLKVRTRGMRYGQNGQRRVGQELVFVMAKPWDAP